MGTCLNSQGFFQLLAQQLHPRCSNLTQRAECREFTESKGNEENVGEKHIKQKVKQSQDWQHKEPIATQVVHNQNSHGIVPIPDVAPFSSITFNGPYSDSRQGSQHHHPTAAITKDLTGTPQRESAFPPPTEQPYGNVAYRHCSYRVKT